MNKKNESIWDKKASKKMLFICFLVILASFICFGGTYLQFKAKNDNEKQANTSTNMLTYQDKDDLKAPEEEEK